MGGKVSRIEISFPIPVDFPPGWERVLSNMVSMVCAKYESEHPLRTMWPAGHGAKPLWNEPEEPTFDDTVFVIDVSEREANERELERRGGKTFEELRTDG